MGDLVSIIVPVYNMENSIETCVKSLQSQDYDNVEIILIDDGSTDKSYDRCLHIASLDKRVKAYHTENRGSGPARNYGIEQSSGKYAYFPDADDYLDSTAISTLVKAMCGGKYDLVVFGYQNLNQNGKILFTKKYEPFSASGSDIRYDYTAYISTNAKFGIQGAPWNKFFDLDVIRKFKIEYPPLRRHQDEGFIARYMCHAENVRFIEDVLYTYYVNDLKKEWQKYPVDYIDAVMGLYETRKQTILTWNENDKKTHDWIAKEYVCKVIKALELSFSPKMKLDKRQRKDWIITTWKKSNASNMTGDFGLRNYQKIVKHFLDASRYRMAYMILHLKVFVEKIIR